MDVFRKCDPYAVLWVDHGPHEATFLTDVKYAEDNPVFNESFTWEYNHSTGKLCVSLWDRDCITADDLIGCVYVDITELAPEEWTELELPLINPAIEKKIRTSTVTLRLRKVPDLSRDHNQKTCSLPAKDSLGDTASDGQEYQLRSAVEFPVNDAEDVAEDQDLTSCQEPRSPIEAACFHAGNGAEIHSPNGPVLSPESTPSSTPQIASAASARRIANNPERGQRVRTEAIQISALVPPTISSNLGFAGYESVMQSRIQSGVEEERGASVPKNVSHVSTLLKSRPASAVDSRGLPSSEDSSTFHC